MTAFQDPAHSVDPAEAQRLIDGRDAQIIDVREEYEHEAGHIPGDRHLDLQHVALETDSIDTDRPVIFYCRAGIRSAMPTEAFRAAGWEAYNLTGGLLAWTAADQTIEPADGEVAPH